MAYKDRIKEIRKVKGTDLLANPKNWRIHPESQLSGLHSILSSVGKVGALIAWESPEGLMLIDGHGRVELNPDEEWTVLILDIKDEAEVDKILATFDPLSDLVVTDTDMLSDLLHRFDPDDSNDSILLSIIPSVDTGANDDEEEVPPPILQSPVSFPVVHPDSMTIDHECPKCGYKW